MLALLSGAWWASRLASPVLHAAGISLGVAAVAGSIGLGLMWLREDARADARAAAALQRASLEAENAALKAAAARQATTLRLRKQMVMASQLALAELEAEMEEKRNASPSPDTMVLPPGDPWLDRPARRLPKRPRP